MSVFYFYGKLSEELPLFAKESDADFMLSDFYMVVS